MKAGAFASVALMRSRGARAFGSTADQRGFARTIDWGNIPNGPCTGSELFGPTPTLATDIGAVELLGPTAADVSISGRVKTANGRGIMNVTVIMRDLNGKIVGTALTGTFGYYSIAGLAAGRSYVVGVRSKRFGFPVPNVVVSLKDSIEGLDFVASP